MGDALFPGMYIFSTLFVASIQAHFHTHISFVLLFLSPLPPAHSPSLYLNGEAPMSNCVACGCFWNLEEVVPENKATHSRVSFVWKIIGNLRSK